LEIPSNLSYTKDHEWITNRSGKAEVGITAFAVDQLGDIVHIELPDVGQSFGAGESFGTVESTKTVSDLNMPLAGKIVEVNKAVLDKPESLQENAYGKGWLVKVEITSAGATGELMDATAYGKFIKDQH
jgi:glycine cleavage system H protein